jgi:hypothetical protein
MQKNLEKNFFFGGHFESHWRKEQYPDLEPVLDPDP